MNPQSRINQLRVELEGNLGTDREIEYLDGTKVFGKIRQDGIGQLYVETMHGWQEIFLILVRNIWK